MRSHAALHLVAGHAHSQERVHLVHVKCSDIGWLTCRQSGFIEVIVRHSKHGVVGNAAALISDYAIAGSWRWRLVHILAGRLQHQVPLCY